MASNKKRMLAVTAGALLASSVLAACGSGDDDKNSEGAGSKGGTVAGRRPSIRITCQPNCDCTGSLRSPAFFNANAVAAKAGSISLLANQASLPLLI